MNNVRVRFAPSPTGFLHVGGLRTALYDYLYARKYGGKFILRIEDTDRNRLVPGAIENLISTLLYLGLEIDEGPGTTAKFGSYIQSERLDIYHTIAQKLLSEGHAYNCFCTSETLTQMRNEQQQRGEFVKYDRRCLSLSEHDVARRLSQKEPHVVRLKMPDNYVFEFTDLIRGDVAIDSSQLDDQVLIKSDGFPTYHLAAVVDDHLMEISHVIRGEEWLSSTPKHIWLYHCLDWLPPSWVHLPLILNPDRSKLSKRMNDVSVESYLQKGYLKEALLNFVALLGWHSSEDREIYSLEELCKEFSLERVSKAGAVFDVTKLDWLNGWYMRNLPLEDITTRVEPFFGRTQIDLPEPSMLSSIVAAARERCSTLGDIVDYSRMFLNDPVADEEGTIYLQSESAQRVLGWFLSSLTESEDLKDIDFENLLKSGIHSTGLKGKDFYTPLRLALLGQPHGPDLNTIVSILGLPRVRLLVSRNLKSDA